MPAKLLLLAMVIAASAVLFDCLGLGTVLVFAIVAAIAFISWQKWAPPRDPLMELAAGIHGSPPDDLTARAKRIAAKKALAQPPPTQEEELKMLDASPAPRFTIHDPRWLAHLDQEGYAVVAAVADDENLSRAQDLLWEFLEKQTPWRRHDNKTWTDAGIGSIGSIHNGLTNGSGMGQSEFLWHLRTLPTVRQAFEKIWSTKDLIVSFDSAGIFRPWHHGFKKTSGGWWHVDQGRGKQGRHAVQGLVSLFPQDGKTGGLTVVPRSHLRFNEVVEDQQNPDIDYVTVQPYCPVLQELPRRLVSCQAGDLVLWDSRTIHANAPAIEGPVAPADRLLRAVAYICMTPASFAPADVLKLRRSAYENWFSTSHWPHKCDLGSGNEGAQPRSLSDAAPNVIALVG